ncbi:hypothetical protein [Clostridium tagluense]|uniref:hypothetical protein n=1 Tax=Clostridium tagluense TaxID=360422 RepID=UPI001CF41392|nr:hypothetical protein [Clostridium tagluense]MCB2297055.1 hypothetical protein [Clostridium tagluense]
MFEDVIPKELVIGDAYTSEQIVGYMDKYKVHILCDESQYIDSKDETNYFVNGYFESYVHYFEGGRQCCPPPKTKFYEISKFKKVDVSNRPRCNQEGIKF